MTHSAYDAAGFAVFNMETGEIRSRENEQLALIPIDVIAELTPREGLENAARAWGLVHGERLNKTLSNENSLEMEILASHVGGTLAVFGLGNVSMEIRGDALLFKIQTISTPTIISILKGFLGGFVSALRPESHFEAMHLENSLKGEIFWVGSPASVLKMKTLITDGNDPLTALDKLAVGGK